MALSVMLAIGGIVSSLVGAVLLAISLNGVLSALALAVNAHDTTIEMLVDPASDVPVFTGLDKHIQEGEATARRRTMLGIGLCCLGAVAQSAALLVSLLGGR